ncbi:MAG: aminotransferase IV [Bacteroidetes bacterium]|nr:aminotransferase IV [Bacteroidota bacterium]
MPLNYNGKIMAADQPIFTANNRAFRYGDGFFETIRVFDGKMPFFEKHWHRLSSGCKMLGLEFGENFCPSFFKHEIEKLTEASGNWRVRLTVWRSGSGLYSPETNLGEFLIEATPLPDSFFTLNHQGLVVGIFKKYLLPQTTFQEQPVHPPIKSSAALIQVLASIAKKEAAWDDCLMLNTANRIACGTSSNIFMVKNGELYFPPLTEGCVAGTMRAILLDLANKHDIKSHESQLDISELKTAEELFLSNAVLGIRWIEQISEIGKIYSFTLTQFLLEQINLEYLIPNNS